MVRRRQRRHLVPVARVLKEEVFDLLRDLKQESNETRKLHSLSFTWNGESMLPHSLTSFVNML
jgi:hypothetical protein